MMDRGLYWVSKGDLSHRAWMNIQLDLHVHEKQSDKFRMGKKEAPREVILFEEEDGKIGVPRWYAVQKMGVDPALVLPHVPDRDVEPFPWRSEPQFQPWPEQVPTIERAVDQLQLTGGAIIQAKCGAGKTVMALKVAQMMARLGHARTLVLVHKEFLIDQWLKRILRFTHIPAYLVGLVQQDDMKIGPNITMGMVESLAARDYTDALYTAFDLIITDEIHRFGAATWAPQIAKFEARWKLGLSARPYRNDGLDPVFRWHIGPVIEAAEPRTLQGQVYQLDTGINIPDQHLFEGDKYAVKLRFRDGKLSPARIQSFLGEHVSRNNLIARVTAGACEKGRKIVVFSHRRDQLNSIARHLVVNHGLGPQKVGFYVGERKQADLDAAAEKPVILSTYQMAAEALDIPELDTMVQATPPIALEQPVGRIERWLPDKREPLIIDLVDRGPIAQELCQIRERQYKRLNWRFHRKSS